MRSDRLRWCSPGRGTALPSDGPRLRRDGRRTGRCHRSVRRLAPWRLCGLDGGSRTARGSCLGEPAGEPGSDGVGCQCITRIYYSIAQEMQMTMPRPKQMVVRLTERETRGVPQSSGACRPPLLRLGPSTPGRGGRPGYKGTLAPGPGGFVGSGLSGQEGRGAVHAVFSVDRCPRRGPDRSAP